MTDYDAATKIPHTIFAFASIAASCYFFYLGFIGSRNIDSKLYVAVFLYVLLYISVFWIIDYYYLLGYLQLDSGQGG